MEYGIYGNHIERMKEILNSMQERICGLREKALAEYGMDPVEHYLARIKSDESD